MISLIIFLIPCAAFSSDYDDCVMKRMKDAQTDLAVKLVISSCYDLTLPKACKGENLKKYKNDLILKKQTENSEKIKQLKNDIAWLQKEAKLSKYSIKSSGDYFLSAPERDIIGKQSEIKELMSVEDNEALGACKQSCNDKDYFSRKFGECSNDW